MKKILTLLLTAAAVCASCARQPETDTGALKAEALAAYMQKYHPDAVQTALGAYIFPADEVAGTGAALADEAYVRVDYTITDRNGSFSSSTIAEVNKSNKNYSARRYYGPAVRYRGNNALTAGVEQVLTGGGTEFGPMKIGGTRKALIPGWLFSTAIHDTAEEYYGASSASEAVYTITLVEAFEDEDVWEKDSLARYIAANYPKAVEDTLVGGGWYYVVKKAVADTAHIPSDSTVYCNYILRDLAGRVIDSNLEKVARDNGFYSEDATYGPKQINMNSDYTKITMGSSTDDVVDGFANAFLHMHPNEAGIAIFRSALGYASRGSGSTIPAYCPLSFEIELVAKEN